MNTCRKLLSALLCLALLASVLPLSAVPARADTLAGNGTQDDPYLIKDAEDLIEFAEKVNGGRAGIGGDPDACAVLTDDIDLEGSGLSIGLDVSGRNYIGTFDGQGRTISGLYINTTSNTRGLFGYVGEGGTVTNLIVKGTVVSSGSAGYGDGGIVGDNAGTVSNCVSDVAVKSGYNVGGVVGWNRDTGIITNCTNNGTITGTSNDVFVGGVVGTNCGTVQNCTNNGTVETATYAGGVVGVNFGTVSGSYNTKNVAGVTAGGVVGANSYANVSGKVTSCYNTGTVSGTTTAGGVVGANSNGSTSGTVNGCYYLNTVAGSAIGDSSGTSENVASKTTEVFASSEVAWLLQDALGENADQAWGQKLSGETPDEYPVLTSDTSKKVYQVTFKDGDSIFATDYANNSDCVTLPENDPPAVTGKTFDGWYNQETDGTEYENSVPVNGSDLVVYAQFTENAPALGAGYDINYTAETATAAENYQISTNGTDFSKDTCNITPDGTLYVRYAGNTEKFTTNTIPARLAAPTLTISNEAEGAEISGAYYYSFTSAEYGNTDWKQGTGALVTVEPDDTIYIYKAATDEAFKSNVQTLTAPSRGAAPTLPTIDYGSETLSGTTAEMEYRVGANGEWKQCTVEDMSVTEWMGQTVYFRTAAANENYASDPVSLTIPARPVAPSVQGVNESIAGSNDGKITGLTAEIAYELSHDNGQTWTDVAADSTEITGLAPGTYQVRIKAGTNSFASEAASVIIASGATPTYTLTVSAPTFGNVNEGYTQPAAQASPSPTVATATPPLAV